MTVAEHELVAVDVIAKKRDGGELNEQEIRGMVEGFVRGAVPDYQMSALLMAIVLRGMTSAETLTLTQCMVESGDQFDMSPIGRRIVDKHSTGGVGDKVSLALAPIISACGVPFGKMSGRGLGHTGGTLDKLESIPGYTVEISGPDFLRQVADIGVAIIGQTADIVPADKQLYALRDVTATVESIPLIAASIMSKKLAAGADAIVLDVKVGSGAFMKDAASARQLADEMIAIGDGAGRAVRVLITDMSTPLGCAVGNALEIAEVLELLAGRGPADLRELVLTAAGVLLSVSDLGVTEQEGRARAEAAIASGAARESWNRWITAQGGDPGADLPAAPVQRVVRAPRSGRIAELDALKVGHAAFELGAGRRTKTDDVDHAVGVVLAAKRDSVVEDGDALFTVHARSAEAAERAAEDLLDAVSLVDAQSPFEPRGIVLERRG